MLQFEAICSHSNIIFLISHPDINSLEVCSILSNLYDAMSPRWSAALCCPGSLLPCLYVAMAAKNVCTLLLHKPQPWIVITVDFEILQLKTLVLRQAFSYLGRPFLQAQIMYTFTCICVWMVCTSTLCFCCVKRFVQYKKYRLSSSSEITSLCTEKQELSHVLSSNPEAG